MVLTGLCTPFDEGFGAFILGRNMFRPIRGPSPDGTWKGW